MAINYRRFFDVNELAGLRMEDPMVSRRLTPLLLDLIHRGAVTGVRLDHIDGLFDPLEYCGRIMDATADSGSATCLSWTAKLLTGERVLPGDRLPLKDALSVCPVGIWLAGEMAAP